MAEEQIFLRKASGVVVYGLRLTAGSTTYLAINPVIMISLAYVWAAWLYPAGDMLVAAVICGLFVQRRPLCKQLSIVRCLGLEEIMCFKPG